MSQIVVPDRAARIERVLQVRLEAVVRVNDDRDLSDAVGQALHSLLNGETGPPGKWTTLVVTHDAHERNPDGAGHTLHYPPVQTTVRVRQSYRNDYFEDGKPISNNDPTVISPHCDIAPAEVEVLC